jgi:hypothetical protein
MDMQKSVKGSSFKHSDASSNVPITGVKEKSEPCPLVQRLLALETERTALALQGRADPAKNRVSKLDRMGKHATPRNIPVVASRSTEKANTSSQEPIHRNPPVIVPLGGLHGQGKKRGEGKRVPVSYELSRPTQTPVAYCSLHSACVRRIAGKANTQKKTRVNVQTLGDGREHVAHTREQACDTACTPRTCSNILKNRKEWGRKNSFGRTGEHGHSALTLVSRLCSKSA